MSRVQSLSAPLTHTLCMLCLTLSLQTPVIFIQSHQSHDHIFYEKYKLLEGSHSVHLCKAISLFNPSHFNPVTTVTNQSPSTPFLLLCCCAHPSYCSPLSFLSSHTSHMAKRFFGQTFIYFVDCPKKSNIHFLMKNFMM